MHCAPRQVSSPRCPARPSELLQKIEAAETAILARGVPDGSVVKVGGYKLTASRREQAHSRPSCTVKQVVVVGGGAAGVELCLCLQARWRRLFPVRFVLATRGPRLLDGVPPSVQAEVASQLIERGIDCLFNADAVSVTAGVVHLAGAYWGAAMAVWAVAVLLGTADVDWTLLNSCGRGADGRAIEFDEALWATGAEPHPLAQQGGLGTVACVLPLALRS